MAERKTARSERLCAACAFAEPIPREGTDPQLSTCALTGTVQVTNNHTCRQFKRRKT